jgi:hypothetical protein
MPQAEDHQFAGLSLPDLISSPLVAIAKAQRQMAQEQIRGLLETCMQYDEKNQCYEPVMITMSLTRSFQTNSNSSDSPAEMTRVRTQFQVPLMTILPISTIGVENYDMHFNFEIKTQRTTNNRQNGDDKSLNNSSEEGAPVKSNGGAELYGGIGRRNSASEQSQHGMNENTTSTAHIAISVSARPLPLAKGMLSIIDLYSRAIHPVEIAPS